MTNPDLIAKVEAMAKEPRVMDIAREYDDILEDIGNVELTAEMVAMVMIATERVDQIKRVQS